MLIGEPVQSVLQQLGLAAAVLQLWPINGTDNGWMDGFIAAQWSIKRKTLKRINYVYIKTFVMCIMILGPKWLHWGLIHIQKESDSPVTMVFR